MHTFGQPADMDAILELPNHNLTVIERCCMCWSKIKTSLGAIGISVASPSMQEKASLLVKGMLVTMMTEYESPKSVDIWHGGRT